METTKPPVGQNKLGRKHIKSFASGIANMFACSAHHYAYLAYKHKMPTVAIDLLALRIEPAEFDIERNRILAGMCQWSLLRNVEQLTPPGAVVSAVLSVHFGVDDYWEVGGAAFIGRSVFTVILTDDRGKDWRVDLAEKGIIVQA
jgi:hypothetical protein